MMNLAEKWRLVWVEILVVVVDIVVRVVVAVPVVLIAGIVVANAEILVMVLNIHCGSQIQWWMNGMDSVIVMLVISFKRILDTFIDAVDR